MARFIASLPSPGHQMGVWMCMCVLITTHASPLSPGYPGKHRSKLAVATPDNIVVLFDEQGDKRDKFKTKPADGKDGTVYTVCWE